MHLFSSFTLIADAGRKPAFPSIPQTIRVRGEGEKHAILIVQRHQLPKQNMALGENMDDDAPVNPYFSPTLDHLEHGLGEPVPGDQVACRDCPSSIWYSTSSNELFCHCSAMHQMTWGAGGTPIAFCDGREQAVARLIAESDPQRS